MTDDQPVSVKSSIVDIAYDYTKKKNVFRLTTYNGSEYLFQADDHESMIEWIRIIQVNNNPDDDVSIVCYSVSTMKCHLYYILVLGVVAQWSKVLAAVLWPQSCVN